MTPKVTESEVLIAVRDYLTLRGFRVERRNVAGVVQMAKGGVMRVGHRGQADLTGYHRGTGRHLEVEIKRPGKIPTQEQQQWLQAAFECGCVAFWCSSTKQCEEELARQGVR